jgi:hypothetical protein
LPIASASIGLPLKVKAVLRAMTTLLGKCAMEVVSSSVSASTM